MVINYRKSYASEGCLRWFTLLCMKIWMSVRKFSAGVWWSAKGNKHFYMLEGEVSYLWNTRVKTYSRKLLKMIIFQQILSYLTIILESLNRNFPLWKYLVPKPSHGCWESLLKLFILFQPKTFKDKVIEKYSMKKINMYLVRIYAEFRIYFLDVMAEKSHFRAYQETPFSPNIPSVLENISKKKFWSSGFCQR